MKRARILLADADPSAKSLLGEVLQPLEKFELTAAGGIDVAKSKLSEQTFDLLVAAVG